MRVTRGRYTGRGGRDEFQERYATKHSEVKVKDSYTMHMPAHADTPFGVLHGSWHTRLAAITYDRLPPGPLPGVQLYSDSANWPSRIYDIGDVRAMREEILDMVDNASLSSLEQFWKALPKDRAIRMWMEFMMTMMERSPAKALDFLSITFHQPYPPAYAVGDVLEFIISHYHKHRRAYPASHMDAIEYRVRHMLVHDIRRKRFGSPSEPIHLGPHTLWLLMTMFDVKRLEELYVILVRTNHPLRENTLIQFAYRFAKAGKTDTAFEVLQKLNGVASFNSEPMLNLCAVLLYQEYRDPKAYYGETEIFEFMVSSGLNPNVTTYSVLMLNAIRSGDHETAWKLHDIMLETQIMPNAYTYSILLNDAKRRMDAQDIGQVMSHIRSKGIVSEHLVTDVLHTVYLLQQEKAKQASRGHINTNKEDPLTAFKSMLPVYCDNFKLDHLARIIPGLAEFASQIVPSQTSDNVEKVFMVPPGATLVVMITAYLKSIQNAESLMQLYHRLRELIYQGDPAVEMVVATTHLWDMLLITFNRFPELTAECAHFIEDMLNPVVKPVVVAAPEMTTSISSDQESGDNTTESLDVNLVRPSWSTPDPSVYTWSILLKIFMDAKQAVAAEKVLSIMKERGIEPTIVTWGTLTNGYVRMHDADMVADAVDRLEAAGHAVNDHVLNMLRNVGNRDRFLTKLEEKQRIRKHLAEMKVQADMEAEAEAKAQAGDELAPEPFDEDAWLEEEFGR